MYRIIVWIVKEIVYLVLFEGINIAYKPFTVNMEIGFKYFDHYKIIRNIIIKFSKIYR